eukprot:TRINITY_DN36579_c0_g1_i4.p2 TRINITY_DN36579_c0_g1~~TRINITY_DN36579_c0_g1_i4.p2  ORF type:complete len:121 (+),score=30.41 TRINITY_DN36579_c0_g1_i4:1240-1602(+)
MDILLFHYINPQDFDLDTSSEVATYREVLQVCKSVQIIKKNEKAKYWQNYVDEQIDMAMKEYLETKIEKKASTPPSNLGAGPPPPPPPPAPAPPRPKLFRYPGAEGIRRQHFSGYENRDG